MTGSTGHSRLPLRWGRGVLSAVAALALLAGLLVINEATGASATPPLRWTACAGPGALPGTECATLTVPLDHANPQGETISVALARLPAMDPSKRIGSLLFNSGGPGGSGVDAVAYNPALGEFSEFALLRQRYDLVGFDPRGVGASTPIRCDAPLHNSAISAFPATPGAYAELARFNDAAGQSCRTATGPLIDHVDTLSVVEDVEMIRRALGEDRISWLGLSYGTEIGSLYAEQYPDRVRTMVLDGVVDHSLPTRRAALHEAQATETALHRFAVWCDVNEQCPLAGRDVMGVYDGVLAAADHGQMPAAALGRNVTAEEITNGAYGLLQSSLRWPQLAAALAAAAGLGTPADASSLLAAASFTSPAYPAYRTVGCHDFDPDTRGWPDMTMQIATLRAVAPHTWRYSEFWDWTSGCLGWPVKAANPPRPLSVRGAPPILLVSTRYDPATPYRWAQQLQRNIEGSSLLTVDGDGHTGLLHSSCARSRMAQYLIDGALQSPDLVCSAPATAER